MVIALTTTTISAPRTTFMVAPPRHSSESTLAGPSRLPTSPQALGVGEKNHNADQEDPRGEQQLEPLVPPQQPAAESAPPES